MRATVVGAILGLIVVVAVVQSESAATSQLRALRDVIEHTLEAPRVHIVTSGRGKVGQVVDYVSPDRFRSVDSSLVKGPEDVPLQLIVIGREWWGFGTSLTPTGYKSGFDHCRLDRDGFAKSETFSNLEFAVEQARAVAMTRRGIDTYFRFELQDQLPPGIADVKATVRARGGRIREVRLSLTEQRNERVGRTTGLSLRLSYDSVGLIRPPPATSIRSTRKRCSDAQKIDLGARLDPAVS
jgi:hypothetical protein